uniref:Macro domain-containing protein n=1 Tax=Amphilophus citrinellus TaxID=61819 RepID=A0A3Q0R610_AMPCI
MAIQSDIRLYGFSLNIVKQCGPALSDILNSKFSSVATIEGVDVESEPSFAQQKRPTLGEEKRFSVRLPAGVHVSVWKADLTTFEVDAVANAANCSLQHGGGLARALCEAGGPQIQKESDIHVNTHGPLRTSQAIITAAGSLPCKVIIHAVGPQLFYHFTRSDVLAAKPLLEQTIWSILHMVKQNHLDTVAIPAISSGLFNYPLQECAQTIVSTVKDYYERSSPQEHLPKEIFFVNRDEPTVTEMEKACRQILAPHQPYQLVPYSHMVSQIGFHAECAPPEAYGEGIYFTGTVKKAMEVWKEKNDQYLYFVVAQVLTGKSTLGKPGLILPPAVGPDPQVRFDSVKGGSDISVIFCSYQALPIYIITCKKMF